MNADRLARWYRWIEYAAFGRGLERRRFAFLDRLSGARCVALLGEGDGRSLEKLLALAPGACFDVYELSGEMIALARRRVGDHERVRFVQVDARVCAWPEGHYDGVVTCFFLDCFSEADAQELIQRLAHSLTPGGTWLVSEFAIPPAGWRRWHARIWIWTMYRFFALATGLRVRALPPYERFLSESGMDRTEKEAERAGLMTSEVWVKRL